MEDTAGKGGTDVVELHEVERVGGVEVEKKLLLLVVDGGGRLLGGGGCRSVALSGMLLGVGCCWETIVGLGGF